MPKTERKDKGIALVFSEKEANELGLREGTGMELYKAKQGIWVLASTENTKEQEMPAETEKQTPSLEQLQIDAKIFSLLESKNIADRVEGKFEAQLSQKEKERFRQLLKEQKIVLFKSSPKYIKFVYKKAPEKKKESEQENALEKPIEEYSLEKDGFLVARNEQRAKRISQDYETEIKEGKIKGLKSFDGNFYIIESSLLEKYRGQVLSTIKANKNLFLSQLAKNTRVSQTLSKIVCEFLKEDGEIIEKRKELYQPV